YIDDGSHPDGSLVILSNTIYGTTRAGGTYGKGTVFSINDNSTDFTTIHHFAGADGATPSGLILSSNSLYGTTYSGGTLGYGTIYVIQLDGTGFKTLHNFGSPTNSGGTYPRPGLTATDDVLYGGTSYGGSSGSGTLFKINIDGTGFRTLHDFSAKVGESNSDGASPNGELTLSANILFGNASYGGRDGRGQWVALQNRGWGCYEMQYF